MNRRVLIVKRSDLQFDIRCQRIATHLSQKFDVSVLGTDSSANLSVKQTKIADYDHARLNIPARAIRKIRREVMLRNIQEKTFDYRISKDKWIWEVVKYLNSNSFEIIIACDIDSIASTLLSKSKALLVGDMHEHAPTELANKSGWTEKYGNYRKWQCEVFLPSVQELFTVSESLAKLYESEFNLPRVNVMRNAAPFHNRTRPHSLTPPKNFIHHGIAAQIRGLEEHAVLASALGLDYSVSMLVKPVEFEYYRFLKDAQRVVRNFYMLNPVQPSEMIHAISRFDAGIYLLNPLTSQLKVTLPNKVFEFVQARLPIFSGGLKEIDNLIDQYGIGVKLETFDGIQASSVIKNNQDLDWKRIHENLDFAARELSSENEFDKLVMKIEQI